MEKWLLATCWKLHKYQCFCCRCCPKTLQIPWYFAIKNGHQFFFRPEGPRASLPSSTTVTTTSISAWILFFHFFLRCYCGDAFYSDTFLQTDDVTHKSLYTEQLLCADTLTQGGLCTDKLYTQTSLRSEAFMQRIFYTIFYIPILYIKILCAHTRLYTQTDLHRIFTHTTFYTEKPLYRTGSTQFFFNTKALTQKNLYT